MISFADKVTSCRLKPLFSFQSLVTDNLELVVQKRWLDSASQFFVIKNVKSSFYGEGVHTVYLS